MGCFQLLLLSISGGCASALVVAVASTVFAVSLAATSWLHRWQRRWDSLPGTERILKKKQKMLKHQNQTMDFYHRKKCREKVYQMIKTSFVTVLDWALPLWCSASLRKHNHQLTGEMKWHWSTVGGATGSNRTMCRFGSGSLILEAIRFALGLFRNNESAPQREHKQKCTGYLHTVR